MKVYLYYANPTVFAVEYRTQDFAKKWLINIPEDVLDRYDKALEEYQAVQRILELYKNEG